MQVFLFLNNDAFGASAGLFLLCLAVADFEMPREIRQHWFQKFFQQGQVVLWLDDELTITEFPREPRRGVVQCAGRWGGLRENVST